MKLMKIATTIIILCAVVFLAVSCSSKSTATVKTQTVTAQKGSISVAITGTGNLALSRTESLAFEMSGTVAEVLVSASETVKKGQELVTLDTSAWETQLKTLEKALVTAQRNQTTKEKALNTAERQVITRESAVATAERQVTAKEYLVQQAQLNVQSANNTLYQITVVKKAQDEIDNAEYALKFATSVLGGELGGGLTGDVTYWTQLQALARTELIQAKEDLQDILNGYNLTISTDVALLVAKDKLAVTKSQMDLEDAQIAIDTAKSAVADAQLAVADANSSVDDAKIDVADAKTAVADAQENLDEAKSLSPVITAPFDGFISSIKVAGGDDILKGTVALVIADPDQFSAKISVTEDDIASVKVGANATVTITSLSDSFPAKVTAISPTATVSSGVVSYSVTVNITSLQPIITATTASQLPALSANRTMPSGTPPTGVFPAGSSFPTTGNVTAPAFASNTTTSTTSTSASTANVTLRDGLSATVEIVSQQKDNILIILSKAITTKSGVSTVQVVTTGAVTETRTVTTGLTDGTYTEITSGLTEGEVVQIKTSSSSSSTASTMTISAQQQLQSISGGVPSGGPPGGPPGGGF